MKKATTASLGHQLRLHQSGRFRLGVLLTFLILPFPARADPPRGLGLPPPQTQVYCRDSGHVYQPLVRTTFARLWNDFQAKLGLIGRMQGSQLIFRGGRRNAETITYSIEPHQGGIALLAMRVRLYHLSEDRTGTDMCVRTFVIINGPSAP